MRGKVSSAFSKKVALRITPACAGKRCSLLAGPPHPEDHPRVCGEKCVPISGRWSGIGSPPRVRGKVAPFHCTNSHGGITPACAGKSILQKASRRICRDHPRVCGEKRCATRFWRTTTGSPPRVRGKGAVRYQDRRFKRITPACAGKRLRRPSPVKKQ